MSENKFLYALKDDLPQDFSDTLREQLRQIEHDEQIKQDSIAPKANRSAWWLLAVASVLLTIFGVIFFVSNQPSFDVLNIAQQLPPTLTNHGEITPETISDLQHITTLGNGFAWQLRLSPDGETVAVDSSAGLYLHDAYDLNAEPHQIIVPERFSLIDFADDGTIYGVVFNYEGDETILQIDPETNQITELFSLAQGYYSNFDISADGSRLFVQVCNPETEDTYCDTDEWQTQVYDTETGTLGLEFRAIYRASAYTAGYGQSTVSDVAQDGSRYVYVVKENEEYVLHLLDVESGQSQAILRLGTEGNFTSLQWIQLSPDNQTLLISRFTQVKLWDIERLLASDTLLDSRLDEPDRGVSMDTRIATLFNPDEDTLIGISDSIVHTYNISTGEGESTFESDLAGEDFLSPLEISPSGDAFYGILTTGELVRYSQPDGMITDISPYYDGGWQHQFFFTDEHHLLSAGTHYSGTLLREWSLTEDEPRSEIFQPNGGIVYPIRPQIMLSPNGQYLAYSGADSEGSIGSYNWFHDLETGERHRMSVFFADRGGIITPDNRLIGLGTNIAYVYEIENILNNENFNQDYSSFYLDDDYINNWYWFFSDQNSISLNGNLMATLPCLPFEHGETNTPCLIDVALWDLVNGDVAYTLAIENVEKTLATGLSADGQFLSVATCNDIEENPGYECSTVYVYDISDLPTNDSGDILELDIEPIAILETLIHDVRAIRFHPTVFADGSRIVAVSDNQSLTTFIRIEADNSVETLATLPIQGSVTFSPSGNLLVTSNRRGQIELWGVHSERPDIVSQSETEDLSIASREVITSQNITQAEGILALGNGHAYRMALSPDDEILAIASSDGIYLHNAQNLNAEPQFIGSPSDGVRYLEYADNGDLYLVTSKLDLFGYHRWDASNNEFIALYGNSAMSNKVIQHIDISPDGSQLLLATCEGTNGVISVAPYTYCQSPAQVEIQIIDLDNQGNETFIPIQNSSNAIVAVNPEWTQIAYYDNGSIYIYEVATSESRRVIDVVTSTNGNISTGLPHELWSLYFTPDGSELAFLGTANGDFELWSIDELNQVENDNPLVRREDVSNFPSTWTAILTFHPQTNDRLVSRSDRISAFSAENGSRLGEFSNILRTRSIEFSSDGERLYTLSATGEIQVHNWSTSEQIDNNTNYTLGFRMSVSISDDSQLIVNNDGSNDDSLSFVWNINNDVEPQLLAPNNSAPRPTAINAISPDNRYVAYINNFNIYVYDRDMNEHREIDMVTSLIDLEFRDDGSLISLTTERGYGIIKTYSPEQLETGNTRYPHEGTQIEDLVFGGNGYSGYIAPFIRSAILSPNGETIAIRHCDNFLEDYPLATSCNILSITLVDAITGERIADLETTLSSASSYEQLVYSVDGQYLAMGYCADTSSQGWGCEDNQGQIDFWHIADIQSGQLDPYITLTDLPYYQMEMSFIVYDDGSLLLEASDWEPVSGDIYETFTRFWSITADGTATEIQRIQANVLGFSPDGRLMIILENGQIELWAVHQDMSTVSSE